MFFKSIIKNKNFNKNAVNILKKPERTFKEILMLMKIFEEIKFFKTLEIDVVQDICKILKYEFCKENDTLFEIGSLIN